MLSYLQSVFDEKVVPVQVRPVGMSEAEAAEYQQVSGSLTVAIILAIAVIHCIVLDISFIAELLFLPGALIACLFW